MKPQYNASGQIDHYTMQTSKIEYTEKRESKAVKVFVLVLFLVTLCGLLVFLAPLFTG